MGKEAKIVYSLMVLAGIGFGCAKKPVEEASTSTRSLYVASGTCYSGGNTLPTPSNIIYKVNLSTGVSDSILADYAIVTETGSTPVSIVNFDKDYLLALVENTNGRKIEKIAKVQSATKTNYLSLGNATPNNTIMKNLVRNSTDGSLFYSRSSAVEKYDASLARKTVTVGGVQVPWLSAPAGNCSTSATNITSVQLTSNGKLIYTHANAAQNKIGLIASTGYTAAADCVLSTPVSAPVASAFPTSSVYIPELKQLLVVYAGNATTTDFNSVYAYDVDETNNTISGATRAFSDTSVIYGASAIAYDSSTQSVYISTSNASATTITNYNIEKFTYDSSTKTLTRVGNVPFATSWIGSKCISSMFVSE